MSKLGTKFNSEAARRQFPALQTQKQVFFDNAGGSQILGSVVTS
jgi:selenocysteine lyase/cysteine desulfurase